MGSLGHPTVNPMTRARTLVRTCSPVSPFGVRRIGRRAGEVAVKLISERRGLRGGAACVRE